MILTLTATLAIVLLDHASLRAAPHANANELAALWQGDVLEIRDQRPGYLQVYDYRRERGGYLRSDLAHPVNLTEAEAPELLAVMRFLRESPGSEALGISYGAAYLKAVPAKSLTAEPFDAIGQMAERLADKASAVPSPSIGLAEHLEVVQQFGVRMRSFERNGRMQVCYDGELFHRVLAMANATDEQRSHATLGLTRPDCIDPNLGPVARRALDEQRRGVLDGLNGHEVSPMTRSRIHARAAGIWASTAYEQARHGESPGAAAERAMTELLSARAADLGDERQFEYSDSVLRVSAIRWGRPSAARPSAAQPSKAAQSNPWVLTATAAEPGQTCIALIDARRHSEAPLVRRCTYGIPWMASAQAIPQGPALVLAVQPLESWRELWVFHQKSGSWVIDVLSPGTGDPEAGYVEFAGFAPVSRRLLAAREVRERGRYVRRFEEYRIDDLAMVRQASSPDLLRDFSLWQDAAWRRDTLSLR